MENDRRDPKADSAPPRKKPYAAPRIEESGSFERLVLACSHKAGACGGKPGTPTGPSS
jgi:hypothetical protein